MRTFVALSVPDQGPARRFLEACRSRLEQTGGDARWTRPEQWHITLRFIGEVPEEQLPRLFEAVQTAAAALQPFEVALKGWGVFPERGRPRVVWAGADSIPSSDAGYRGRMLWAAHEFVYRELSRAGVPDRRETFQPHVTLARVKPPGDIGPLLNILRTEPPPPSAAFTATHVTLFQSVLSPHGSIYTSLLEAPLGN